MMYRSPYSTFIFEAYSYDVTTGEATFRYSFDSTRHFTERVYLFAGQQDYDEEVFERALQLAHIVIGISYYKAFPTRTMSVKSFSLSSEHAEFFSMIYRDGLSQFVYENNLAPDDIAQFEADPSAEELSRLSSYESEGSLVLQSGGKDSLLLATLLENKQLPYDALYVSSSESHPSVLNKIYAKQLITDRRIIDRDALRIATEEGGLNGHVPVTYIILCIALLQAILMKKSTILMAAGQEGEEPHAYIDDYAVRHQWSKTWLAEQAFADFVRHTIAANIQVGSPLRGYSELKIAKGFAEICWSAFGHDFSSCNVANYKQGQMNDELSWCGNCSKCANSFLLFAPWVEPGELIATFGANLFAAKSLERDFKGLLGADEAFKPFECVGEIDELRLAYHLARQNFPAAGYELPFDVPESGFDIERTGPSQSWATRMIQ